MRPLVPSLCALLLSAMGAAGAEPTGDVGAQLSCERRPGKGRVVCEVEVEVRDGRITWADVVVVSVPPFARALKSRVGFREAAARTQRRVRLPVALIAKRLGQGRLGVRARAVVCTPGTDGERCVPHEVLVEGDVLVGPIRSAPEG